MKLINKINVIAPFLILSLGLASCSDDKSGSKVVTPWEIQAPYFKVYNNQTDQAEKSQALNRIDLNATQISLSTTDELIIEEADKLSQAQLKAQTLCETTEDLSFKQTFQIPLLKENSIYRFLPKEVLLLPPHELKKVKCSVRFTAIASNGSTHDFGQNVNFNLVGENRDLLMKLEDENEPEVTSQWEGVSLVTLQRARYFFLDQKDASTFTLKCADFESSASNPQTLLDLITKAPRNDNLEKDQLCRVFSIGKNRETQITKLFNLRFFDLKNYVESVYSEPKTAGLSMSGHNQLCALVHLNQITLLNRTKYPAYFSAQKLMLKVETVFRKTHRMANLNGQLNITPKARSNPNIKIVGDRTVFVLNPGQKMVVAFELQVPLIDSSIIVTTFDRGPTLDFLAKTSWDDTNESVLTSIPLMSQSKVALSIKPPRR